MTDDQVKEQMQAAQDLCDSYADRVMRLSNELTQINAIRRAEQRQTESLKTQLQTATNKMAELEERLSKAAPEAGAPKANGADASAAAHA